MNLAIRCRLGLRVVDPVDELRTNLLSMQVDRGEASAIALALEYLDHVVILDDRKAHILAEALGLVVAGTRRDRKTEAEWSDRLGETLVRSVARSWISGGRRR